MSQEVLQNYHRELIKSLKDWSESIAKPEEFLKLVDEIELAFAAMQDVSRAPSLTTDNEGRK